ncbi:MAG: DNA adenine methylase [Myxococcales bacterium]|nr:DNA adenine methylase [Myxococcales bacterium]MDH3485022.1 DNA adenine methylase [Myxococcales bacterium]
MTTSAAVAARIEQQPREAAPFVKWAGGKGRLLSQLRPLLPAGIARMRHVEPFVGGGALFFARLPERALLTDINPALVATYAAIRDDVQSVIEGLRALATRHSKESYYQVRERYNQGRRLSTSKRAAMFIYLNKTCFNGLHRVNRKGEFNVPVGSYKDPRILNENGLYAASHALRGAKLECSGFESLLEKAKPGDFVYFDPPYEPVSDTASFTAYARGGFSREDQTRLRDVYRALDRRGCKLMLSNSDVPVIRKLYLDFRIDTVAAPRAINCNAKKRGNVIELVVRNY